MTPELAIYFAAAVRGGRAELARRIAFLDTLGRVTTRHMASNVDLGLDDAAIFDHDQRLLAGSHVFVADLAAASTGAGFMAARAVAAGMPVLCLYPEGTRPSAMIAGCPGITTRHYASEPQGEQVPWGHAGDDGFAAAVRRFLLDHCAAFAGLATRGPKIALAGPPGSGKGTLGAALAAAIGAVHVSTGALLRELVQRQHPHRADIDACMRDGRLVPAAIMRDIVVERLRAPDCRLFGFLLDGYPPSVADLANLRAAGIAPELVLYLDCSDATAATRQVGRGARATDHPDKARERLAVFHAAGTGYDALATTWFPDAMVVRVDAERTPAEVEAAALEVIGNLFGPAERDRAYFPIPGEPRSTRVHFHVDARDARAVRAIATAIYARHKPAQGQIKIHPIAALALGPQQRLPIYRRMPNFHAIVDSDHEAFATGRLGDGDPVLMEAVLAATRAHGGMAEIEEYVGEWVLAPDGGVTEAMRGEPRSPPRFPAYDDALCAPLPKLELHLGFDLPKRGGDMPIALADLVERCAARGLDNGGWFVFRKPDVWAYRSNEFSDDDLPVATAKLHAQAKVLLELVHAEVSYGLEIVHGIWVF